MEKHKKCMICKSDTEFFFCKDYPVFETSPFDNILTVDYHKCKKCGFVISKTHQEMSEQLWGALNSAWHHFFELNKEKSFTNQPPYAEQAMALALLSKNGLLNTCNVLDYAAGYGTLSKILQKYFHYAISVFDRYITDNSGHVNYVTQLNTASYDVVINSAMFEHVLDRADLDEVNDLVSNSGVLMLHTVVCERIPKDPNWFYLTPMVHTAFHTNNSMQLLMEQWGYTASVYSPQAKSWFLFKKDYPHLFELEEKIDQINKELQTRYFYFKYGFVDYWKGF